MYQWRMMGKSATSSSVRRVSVSSCSIVARESSPRPNPACTLCLMASGKKLSEMADIMSLSPKTVSVYRSRLLEKMKLKNNAEAIHYAISNHLIE